MFLNAAPRQAQHSPMIHLKSSQGQEDGIFLTYEQIRRNAGRGALPTLCRCCPSALLESKEV